MTITLQALSLVEKAEPVQVRFFTLRSRDQRSMWMQDDGCKVCVNSYMASSGSCFMVTRTIFKKPSLGGRPNTKPRDHGTSSTLIGGKGGDGPSSLLHTTLEGTNGVCECKMMDVKSAWIPTWHPMDHVSLSLGLFSIDHLLEVGLTRNHETTALWTLTTVGLFYFIMCDDPHELKFIGIAFGWGPGHIWLHTSLESPWLHNFGGVLGQPLDTFFWALSILWSQLLARVWSDP